MPPSTDETAPPGVSDLLLSMAVLGSVLAGVFTSSMPAGAPEAARESIGVAFRTPELVEPAKAAFTDAMHVGCFVGAGFCLAAALLALWDHRRR